MTPQHQADAAVAPIVNLSRRRVLKTLLWGSAGAAALTAGGFAWLRRSPVDRLPAPEHLQHLSASEYHLFKRAIEVLLPTDGTTLTPVEQIPVIDYIDQLMGLVDPVIREELGIGLTLFDNAAVIVGLHGRRFVDLSTADAVRYFDNWSRGNTVQRTLATVVKKFVYVSYWRDPATWPPIQFDGPVSDRWGIPSLGNTPIPDESEEHRA
jgi:hypothetical protein